MSGYQDPYSGLFGQFSLGQWNWPVIFFLLWVGLIGLLMLTIFIGFDSGGFLHRLEERLGMRNIDRKELDEDVK